MAPDTADKYDVITAPRTIRLMHVQPGNEIDPVHICLVTTTLEAAPDFEAISYCWGNAQDQRQVICNGTIISITNSLFTGLVHFRHSNQPRTLWADGVCINQANAAEKSGQVLLMPDIYSQATRVLVWLGITDDPVYGSVLPSVATSIRQALQLLPNFDPESVTDRAAKSQALRHDSQRLHEEGKPNVLDHDWKPLAALLARPWFRRKWVVQEVSVARQAVLYAGGGVEVPWLELANLAFGMEGLGVDGLLRFALEEREVEAGNTSHEKRQQGATSDDRKIERSELHGLALSLHCVVAIYMIQTFRHSGTLLDGVVATSFFRCTDPRDHVFSLLSLGAIGPTIRPDYDALTGDVFRRFSIAMLVEGQSLKLLSLAPDKSIFASPNAQRLKGIPSWVPDLRLMRADVLVSYTVRPQAYSAGGHANPILSVDEDQCVLSCQGRVIDNVKAFPVSLIEMMLADVPEMRFTWEALTDPLPKGRKKRFARWIEGCYRVAFGHSPSSQELAASGEELMAAFARTMMCGVDGMRNRLSPELIAAFPRYIQWTIDHAENKNDEMRQHPAMIPNYFSTIDETMTGFLTLNFCVTENGHFGRIPVNSQPGDHVCVLVGGEVPFIMRPTGRGTYTLIGECYVDGVMDGEALEEVAATADLLETISLE